MGEICQRFWIERLRKLVKSTIYKFHLCKRYRAKPLVKTGTTPLPTYRTIATKSFATTGVDLAGLFTYKTDDGLDGKAYLTLFACATSGAVHLDLAENMEADTFRRSLKEFIARRGNPDMMVSDNAKTFQKTDKWLKKIRQDANINTLLTKWNMKWKFNLFHSP